MSIIEKKITNFLAEAGIEVGGTRDFDVKVKDKRFFSKILLSGDIGLGESYVNKYFECKKIDELIFRAIKYGIKNKTYEASKWAFLGQLFLNLQSVRNSLVVAKKHYNIEAKVFKNFLDEKMIYSSGYWHNAKNLKEAQEHKLDLIAKKLRFQEGMKVLDIGCGWGGSAKYFATKYKVNVVAITVSESQHDYAVQNNSHKNINYFLADYRNHLGSYDAIYSIGMFEHVGIKNYRTFFDIILNNLSKTNGSFLLHTIGMANNNKVQSSWLRKYIFPHGELPSQLQIATSINKLFMIDDWHNFGCDYDKTLMQWYKSFVKNYSNFQNERYDEIFFRTWEYYFLSCAGVFRARFLQLWQILLTPTNTKKLPFDIPKVR